MPIGPQLPPHLAASASRSCSRSPTPSDSDDDGDFGPALPPALAAQRAKAVGPQLPSTSSRSRSRSSSSGPGVGPSRRDVGPSRPGPSAPAPDSDSDSDSDVGPRLSDAGAGGRSAADEFREREARMAEARAGGGAAAKKVERDEWMLVPPTAGVLASVNPLKRPTQFNRSSKPIVTAEEQREWTETPAERAKRLDEERRGIKRPAASGEDDMERKRRRERDRQIRENVEAHNKASRGPSLLEQHQKSKKESGETDEKPIWDREKYLGVTGRLLTDQERAKKIKDARGLNDRFGHGKGGAYAI